MNADMDCRTEVRPGRILNVTTHQHPGSDTTVFFIHGMGGRSTQWLNQIALLKKEFNLVIPDLLGQGNSDKPPSSTPNPYGFTELERDCRSLFMRYATKNNIIIGHSYGGGLAATLALDHQDMVSKLVLISPIACTPNIPIPLAYRLPAFMLEWLRPVLENQFIQLAFMPNADPSLVTREKMAGRENPMHVIKSIIYGMTNMPRLDVTMLTVPTLILLGKYDKLIPPAITQKFYAHVPHLQLKVIDSAAHFGMLEQAEAVNNAIIEFLSLSTLSSPLDPRQRHSQHQPC